MFDEMRRDPRVYTMATSVSPALLEEYGPERVKRMPISEATMTGIAVGSAGCGFRPVVHWRSVTFAFMAFDQVVNQACKIRYMFGGQRDFPIVFRASYANGTRSAAQHSQTGYALYAHLAGLKVVLPSGAADARGLLKSAIRDNNPVVCFEPGRIDPIEEDVADDGDGPGADRRRRRSNARARTRPSWRSATWSTRRSRPPKNLRWTVCPSK